MKSDGAVRCRFYFLIIVRCGAVGFHFFKTFGAVRCGQVLLLKGAVRCGAGYILQESYGAVRCGAVIRSTVVSYGAVERASKFKKRCTVVLNRSHTVQKTYGSRLPSKYQRDPVYSRALPVYKLPWYSRVLPGLLIPVTDTSSNSHSPSTWAPVTRLRVLVPRAWQLIIPYITSPE